MRRVLTILLALGSLLVAATSTAQEPIRIALLIGNKAYRSEVGPLRNPHNDIALVGAALAKQGFQVLPPVRDARRSAILAAVRDLARRLNAAGSGAVGFIYYSGHGAAEKDTNINYLIPVDASEPGSVTFWDESVKLDEILRLLDGARSAAKFIVFDACRNELQLPTKDTTKGLVPVAEQQGMFIAYASAPGRTASDRGERSGPYAAALAAELGNTGLDHLNLFQNVKEAVLASTGGVQQPWESNGLGRRVFLTGLPKPAAPVAVPPPPPASPSAAFSEAQMLWKKLNESRSKAELEAFVKIYGETYFGKLAQQRLAELNKATPPGRAEASHPAAVAPGGANACRGLNETGCKASTECAWIVPTKTGNTQLPFCRREAAAVALKAPAPPPSAQLKPGDTFRDCANVCPEMVVVPAGEFLMGSNDNDDEKPPHNVTIRQPFAAGKFEVTFAEWDACVAEGGCKHRPATNWVRGRQPVHSVSWDDIIKEYLPWLNRKTGKTYRLLSEAEWEYAARAGTRTNYAFGDSISKSQAQFQSDKTVEVGSFQPNKFGLYDMHGNVWEWIEDCYHNDYSGAPADGSAWITACTDGRRVVRGGSWNFHVSPVNPRSALRDRYPVVDRHYSLGFRVGRALN